MKSNINYKMLLPCILLDLMGMVSFTIPLIGEFSDVIWAPIAAYLFKRMFRGALGLYGGIFTFVEELLPFADVVPTFSIAWLYQNVFAKSKSPHTSPREI